VLLLHGFPSSSRMFRDLIPRLSDTYRVIARRKRLFVEV
jgi:pimeloyl-ACP methyl ester carboxylesterase